MNFVLTSDSDFLSNVRKVGEGKSVYGFYIFDSLRIQPKYTLSLFFNGAILRLYRALLCVQAAL